MTKIILTIQKLVEEAKKFSEFESAFHEKSIYGATDGKAVGTYFEHKFQSHLHEKYTYVEGSSAKGVDFPELGVDIKVTKYTQPQSSCPYKSARQKIFGLGYAVLIFVYQKRDDETTRTSNLNIQHCIFVEKEKTADFQLTSGLRKIIENEGNLDDLVSFMFEKNLPVDEIEAYKIGEDLLISPPEQGYLTISNALQWRLQYQRVIEKAGIIPGIHRVHNGY